MASKTEVTITDDMDGSENAKSVSFGYEGVNYEVDLGKKNRAKLEKALAPFIEAGHKVSAQPRRRGAGSRGRSVDTTAVRAWAKEQGLKVSERGRISAEIQARFDAAH